MDEQAVNAAAFVVVSLDHERSRGLGDGGAPSSGDRDGVEAVEASISRQQRPWTSDGHGFGPLTERNGREGEWFGETIEGGGQRGHGLVVVGGEVASGFRSSAGGEERQGSGPVVVADDARTTEDAVELVRASRTGPPVRCRGHRQAARWRRGRATLGTVAALVAGGHHREVGHMEHGDEHGRSGKRQLP